VGDPAAHIRGTLNFNISSLTVFGKLSLPGSANVSSTLRATLLAPVGLSAGDSFVVLNQGSRLRDAVVFAGRNLGGGLVYDPVLGASTLTLVLRAAVHPGRPVVSLSYAPQLPAYVLVEGPAGSFRLDASADLSQWVPLQTNSALAGAWEFEDPNAPGYDHRWYRAAAE
jgi:hypothetical protein